MAGRTYSVQFLVNGALSGQFASAMAAAQNAMNRLGQAARQVNSAMAGSMGTLQGYLSRLQAIAANSSKYAQLKSAIPKTQADLQAQIAKTQQLSAAYQQQKSTLDSYKASMQSLQAQQKSLKSAYESEKATLASLRGQLKSLESSYRTVSAAQGQGSAAAQSLKSQIESLKASINSQRASVQSAKSAYDTMKAAVKSAAQELKAAEAQLRTLGTSFDSSKSKVRGLYEQLRQQKSQLESLKSSLSSAGFSTSNFGASEMKLRSEIEATTRAIERQAQVAARLTTAQGNLNSASSNFSEAQSAFNTVQNAVETVAAPFVEATKTAMTFEHAMSRVKALTQSQLIREGQTDLVAQNMAKLEKQALDLGATTQFTAVQAAEAMGYLGMAGWKTEQIYGTMPGMLDLAAAAGADLAQTADIVSDNMTAMGVPVEKAGHFMDVYAYALTNSNARLTDFGETMKYAAPVAKAYGSTLDETAAMVMMMANAGNKGSMAGTSLRMGLLRLAGPPKTATKEMEKLGLSLSDAQAGALEAEAVIKGLGIDLTGATTAGDKMTRVLMQLHEKTKDLSQNEKLAAFKGIFGVNAETGWLALFDQGPEVFMKYVEGLRNADGYSKQVAGTMMDDTQGALTFLESAIEAASVSVGRALTPTVRAAAETITPLIGRFAQWAEQNPAIIQGVVGIIATLGGLAVAVTGVALAFAGWSFITAQIGMFTAGMAAVRAGMVATEVASLGMAARMGAAFATLWASIAGIANGIRAATMAAWGFIATPLGAALGAALAIIAAMAYVVYSNWDRIAPAMQGVGDAISNALSAAGAAIGNLISALSPIGDAISNLFNGIFEGLQFDGAIDAIVAAFLWLVNVVVGVAVSIVNIFTATVNTVSELFTGLGDVMSQALDGNFVQAGLRAKQMFRDIKSEWSNMDFPKGDFGYDIGANFRQQYQIYKNGYDASAVNTSVGNGMRDIRGDYSQPAAVQQPVTPAPQPAQPIDTAPFQTAVNNVAQSTQQIPQALQPATQAFQQAPQQLQQSIEPVSQALQNFPQSLQPATQALQNFPQALQPATQALQNFPQSLEPATQALAQFPAALEPVNAALTQTSAVMTTVDAAFTTFTASVTASTAAFTENTAQVTASSAALAAFTAALQATLGALAAFTAALMSTIGGLTALASSSSSAAGAVASLGSAAMSAASALQSAASSIASAAASAASAASSASAAAAGAGKPAANYKGGIYNKGAFLTWFAEKSPEAAIPLDKSQRAINLWTQAGQMLGVLPSDGTSAKVDKPSGESTKRGIISIQRLKEKRANQIYETIVNQQNSQIHNTIFTSDSALNNMSSTISKISSVQNSVQSLQEAQFDELGNIIGLNGAAGNVITKYDNDKIKQVKQVAQLKEFRTKQSQIDNATREVIKTSENLRSTQKESLVTRIQEKFSSLIESAKEIFLPTPTENKVDGMTPNPYYGKEIPNRPTVLTERQRYQSEDYLKERTLERIQNSRSYKAISRVMSEDNRKSTSILNRGELNTNIITDVTGGLFSKIFGTDFGLGQILTQGKFKVPAPDIMTKTSTMPQNQPANLPNMPANITSTVFNSETSQTQSKSSSILNRGELNTNIITDITGGLFSKIFGTDFGLGQKLTQGGFKVQAPDIMTRTSTMPAPLLERVNSLSSTERLESVATNSTTQDYSAATFQPTFNINITISGNAENVDTKSIGEQIAFQTRKSFEKEFAEWKHEQSRRAYT